MPSRRRKSRATRPRQNSSTPPNACCRRRPFLSTPISSPISAAIRLLAARFISVVRETPALARITLQDVYTARSLRAMAELLDRKWAHRSKAEDLSFVPPPLLRRFLCGLAQAARASGHPRARDRAMARRVRKLHAADRRGCELFRGNGFAHRRLYVHQHRHGGDRHRREMAGDRQDQAWPLSAMGRLLFPLVAGEAFPWTGPYQMVPGLAHHAALSEGARGENRQGRAHRRDRAGRGRSDLDRAPARASDRTPISPMRGSRATNSSSARSTSAPRPISDRPASSRKMSSSKRAPSSAI